MKSTTKTVAQKVGESVKFIHSKTKLHPELGIILGSGLGNFAESLAVNKVIDTADIPHYPISTVEGHKGKLVFGKLNSIPLLAFQGRVHYYESGNLESILYPIRVAQKLGIKTLILTNAAGGVNKSFSAGDLMVLSDQINLTFENPLKEAKTNSRHTPVYDPELLKIMVKTAAGKKIKIQQGIYCGVKGPSYETASEIEMIRLIGGDAVGMSTVNEASLASALGIRVAGISCITNLATGILDAKLSHAEVTEVADKVKFTFEDLLKGIIENIGR